MAEQQIVMHFAIPAVRAPAPHMISGEPPDALPLAEKIRASIGHQGQGYRLACDARLQTSEIHRATGEPWALLELVQDGQGNSIPAIGRATCRKCIETPEWKDAYAKTPHPMAVKAEDHAVKHGGCC